MEAGEGRCLGMTRNSSVTIAERVGTGCVSGSTGDDGVSVEWVSTG